MPNKTVISKDTLMPLGLVLSICAGVVWMISQLNQIHYKLESLEARMINEWTQHEMEEWTFKLKLKNPALDVPIVEHR